MEAAVDDLSVVRKQPRKSIEGHRFIENGQVVYPEERLRIENHALVSKAVIRFREWRERVESTKTSIQVSDIPPEHTYLITMLAHESDESLNALANRLNDLLSPFERRKEASFSFFKAIKHIIKATAYQERYGLGDVVLLLKGSPPSIPKRLCLFRWQVHDTTRIPKDILDAAGKKRDKRELFSSIFTKAFQSLSESERMELLFNETGTFIIESSAAPVEKKEKKKEPLFSTFKQQEHVSLAPVTQQPRKRLCSSFDTLFYVGLNNTFDLRQRFLEELPASAKKRRGITSPSRIDLKKLWTKSMSGSITEENYGQLRQLKMKLLQFHEDVRPAYYGTWTKALNAGNIVTGRTPFTKHPALDYDYDSEAEWDHDVDGDDIYTLDPDDDDDDMLFITDDENVDVNSDELIMMDEEDAKWVVPEGYLSDDETVHYRKPLRRFAGVVSRPAKWPIAGNKHFPMKPVILGPSLESTEEPENHPLSDFKMHMLIDLPSDDNGFSPFADYSSISKDDRANTATDSTSNLSSSTICFEPDKLKDPLFKREIDKVKQQNRLELINVIVLNKRKTMMGLVAILKRKENFSEFTTAQLQAMIHDLASQEVRGSSKEYNWYLRI